MTFRITAVALLLAAWVAPTKAQTTPELKFIADTLVVQADGTYEADPDIATMTFHIFSQEKELKKAYDAATQSMQQISTLATGNGLRKEDVSTGVLTVAPIYEGDRRKRARSYYVQGEMRLRVRDFSRIGPILDGSIDVGLADFRSLTYSLSDEEAAKKRAVAEAMRRAIAGPALLWTRKDKNWEACAT
jgi:hypothetical protein